MSAPVDLLTQLGVALGCAPPAPSGPEPAPDVCSAIPSRPAPSARELREIAYALERTEIGILHFQGRFKRAERARSRARKLRRRSA